jgi:tRNA threonylcarbamoyladenosine modification (KEOPS) complex Cgi121 subunit
MIEKIEAYDRLVSITGRRNVNIHDVDEFLRLLKDEAKPCTVQLFDADCVAGAKHLFFAAVNAVRAVEQKRNVSDSLSMETMLYASCQRQIRKALDMLGVKPNTSKVAVLLIDKNENTISDAESRVAQRIDGVRDDEALEIREKKKVQRLKRLFDISDLEVETLSDGEIGVEDAVTQLIIERTALLVLEG